MQHSQRRILPTLLVLSAVVLVTACALTNPVLNLDQTSTAEPPPDAAAGEAADSASDPPEVAAQPGALTVTGQQRRYLDALKTAGVRATSDLRALSIGSTVCQAHAAKQSDQAVWEAILPLVRSDVRATRPNSMRVSASEVDDATADYIRIATERLC
ncbi:DUF732 domain-containing protein [Mycolicibacterium litorale]|uniref:DUF732 domain-containing protein n=1 Tax=Mycolicibacterium litorale TaxID=758802 RepID=A0AAD1IQ10_9MYCO|nr:DUF732 domain-containing protein [Mycolicibacterium litorale]MCV7417749.1 hypothetical protein [Mycolicibacterium litorale]TDY06861.1 hypothetical protein BCL50_3200 [Mycolicibacterium litorale]BBY18981.1 hypothetical protein MLIT_45730 [Mycolicibacterium litorale]